MGLVVVGLGRLRRRLPGRRLLSWRGWGRCLLCSVTLSRRRVLLLLLMDMAAVLARLNSEPSHPALMFSRQQLFPTYNCVQDSGNESWEKGICLYDRSDGVIRGLGIRDLTDEDDDEDDGEGEINEDLAFRGPFWIGVVVIALRGLKASGVVGRRRCDWSWIVVLLLFS